MKIRAEFFNLKTVIAALVLCFAAPSVFAAGGKLSADADNLTRALVVGNLSAKLKTALARTDVSVKLSTVEQNAVAKNAVEIKGDAVCLVGAQKQELPIRFAAKVNVAQKSVSNLAYDFVEAAAAPAPEYAPTTNEEFLMKELMKQISRDYKTENIVVALDGVEGSQMAAGEKQFTGVGEVRIGDMIWNKIKFDVTVDESGRAKKVIYDVKK